MKILEKLVNVLKKAPDKPFTTAIIVAGGSGTRVGTDIPKQHILLDDKEVIAHTLLAFEKSNVIDEIVVVCRMGEEALYNSYKDKYSITKLTRSVIGGESRQESVLAGFEAVSENCKFVAIHDGARCLIHSDDIESVVKEAYKYRCATLAKKCTDTVKLTDEKGYIKETLDREKLYLVSTPQVFEKSIYLTSAYLAKKDGVSVTDDNALVERAGFKIKLVEEKFLNIKITRREDLDLAKAILKDR